MLSDVDDREGVGMKLLLVVAMALAALVMIAKPDEACHDPVVEKPAARGLTT